MCVVLDFVAVFRRKPVNSVMTLVSQAGRDGSRVSVVAILILHGSMRIPLIIFGTVLSSTMIFPQTALGCRGPGGEK